jgi:hypothetical protein
MVNDQGRDARNQVLYFEIILKPVFKDKYQLLNNGYTKHFLYIKISHGVHREKT